jgi:hypothetical protein
MMNHPDLGKARKRLSLGPDLSLSACISAGARYLLRRSRVTRTYDAAS